MNVYKSLPRPFFVLAPMDDVTDVVFRQVVADCAPPDLLFTEFVNTAGLQSRGRPRLLHKLQKRPEETNLIAQIWGKVPEDYRTTAAELVEMGFMGIDINMGCPEKSIVKNGCCSALADNWQLAGEIIAAVKEGADGKVPVSVKLRLGNKKIDMDWPKFVLEQGVDMLTVHGRTAKQMSTGLADWDLIGQVREMRDKIAPDTLIVGNGDILSRKQGEELAKKHKLDGIMIGRGIFNDPYIFSKDSPWETIPQAVKSQMYIDHIKLFTNTWQNKERNWESLKRMAKVYIHGVDHASEMRYKLMRSQTPQEMIDALAATIA